jgi:aryl-alcohol dehydrogenase-like predicted oxidoreductase
MIDRRDLLKFTACTGSMLLGARLQQALAAGMMITRPVPSSGEQLPVIGLGSSATFAREARADDVSGLREVLRTLVSNGGKVFDTAPSYGASEQVAGDIANELNIREKIFWATKANVAGFTGSADPAAARAQIEASFAKFRVPKIDLIQVHNLGDVPTQIGILKELKAAKRVRYIGVTTTNPRQYDELLEIMSKEPLDFIGVDYAIDNRTAEEKILPLAVDRKIGTLIYVPFGRNRLFNRVQGRTVPDWAADFDAKTWSQFFLKYLIAQPGVTVVTPATSSADHMLENIGGGIGRLPTPTERKRMVELIESLPT